MLLLLLLLPLWAPPGPRATTTTTTTTTAPKTTAPTKASPLKPASPPAPAPSTTVAQGPPTTTPTTTTPTPTPATTTTEPAGLFPVTRAVSRQGTSFVAIAAPFSPWAVAQLHIRLVADEVTPKARAATTAWAAQLADAGRKFIPTGALEVRVTPDAVVVSLGTEAARVDDALRGVDAILRARSNKPGATPPLPPGLLSVVDDVVSAEQARLMFPGQPLSLPIAGGTLDAATSKALGDAVSADRVVVVVVAADTGEGLLARLTKIVTAPLPRGTPVVTTMAGGPASKVIFLRPDTTPLKSTSTLTWSIPPRADAGLLVLAELLGGRSQRALGTAGIALDVVAADRAAVVRAEEGALDQVRRVAAAPPPPEVVEAARARVSTSRLQALTDPARVAHAVGLAALEGRPTRVEDELAALSSTTPQSVSLAAASLFSAAVVIARTAGPEPTTTPATTPAATTKKP